MQQKENTVPIIEPVARELLLAELTPARKMRNTHRAGNEIYIFSAAECPSLMREVGRLREAAFRGAGGGTGQDGLTVLSPSYPTDTGLIFYPGAKVEGTAYLPLLDQLRQTGLTCVLVEMPFHLAIFDADAAEDVMEQFPDIQHWYIAGHSLGGAMASQFAADHPDEIDGLILLGAYLYGDYPPEDTLTVYGSLNQSVEDEIDYTENVVEIQGGNHAQFGNYGPQKGDAPATISAEEQQARTVEAVAEFIARRQG